MCQTTAVEERDKRRVGEQIEPGARPKAPGRLALLQRFMNTWNHEFPADWDRLGTPAKARAWLRSRNLVSANAHISSQDAARMRELREALRALAMANHGVVWLPATAADVVRRASQDAELRVQIDESGKTRLEPTGNGIEAAAATLLDILHEAQLLGTWPRLKACRQCNYAFYDRSKNRSGAWCAMSICGNRTKNRIYRRSRPNRAGHVPSSGGTSSSSSGSVRRRQLP